MPNETPAPITEPTADTIDYSKFFGPAPTETVVPDVPSTKAEVDDAGNPVIKAPPPETPPVESEIAAALREMREDRAEKSRHREEATSWRAKYDAAVADYEALKSAPSFEDDPIAYARSRKWTPEQQSEIVQMLAYDLNPSAAPQKFMMKIMDSRQAAKDRRDKETRAAEQAEAARAAEAQQLNNYVLQLDAAVSTFGPGAYAANEDWYGDNRQTYVMDLFNLANELADEATKKGVYLDQKDLTAAALAAKLEQRSAEKLAALETRRSRRTKTAAPATPREQGGVQSTGSPVSTKGLNQGGPRPPAETEEERKRRAAEVVFGKR